MKKMFTIILSVLITGLSYSQTTLGIVGQFNGWASPDVVMTNDGTGVWTASNVAITAGGVKFRWDESWAVSFGYDPALTTSPWPSGSATSTNGTDIPAVDGFYDVTFDMNTLTYEFVAVTPPFDNIGFNGNFNSYGTPVSMFTTDGIQYTKSEFHFTSPGMKFVNSTTNQTFGGATVPMGAAVLNGTEIPVTVGFFNVGFDKSIPGYAFQEVPVSLIGDFSGWASDADMVSTDGGVNFTLNGFNMPADGGVKFRSNHSWATNWGSLSFPTGIANTSDNIPVLQGTYDVTFNRVTGAFSFQTASLTENQLVKVSVSPNPANEVVKFNVDADNFTITLVDMAGKVVAKSTSNDMNISSLNNGLYTYLVNTANGVAIGKLIKQ